MSERIKNVILVILLATTVFFSASMWMEFTSVSQKEGEVTTEQIDVWNFISPVRTGLYNEKMYYLYCSRCNLLWENTTDIVEKILDMNLFIEYEEISGINLSDKYMVFDFENSIPVEILLKGAGIDNEVLAKKIFQVDSVIADIDADRIFIVNDSGVYEFSYERNADKILEELYEEESLYIRENYADRIIFDNYELNIPVPFKEQVINPIFVKSEIDIENDEFIEEIAKDYFKEGYDYARKTVESNGNINYIYKNEKVIKIYKEGLLEFYDSAEELLEEKSIYESFREAIKFSDNFLGVPENIYLSRVEKIIEKGKSGYRFIFSYKVMEKPVIFSQVREEKAVQVDVISGKVIFYQRFIRVLDDERNSESELTLTLTPIEIFRNNLDILAVLYLEDEQAGPKEYEAAKDEIIESIKEIYIAYFDPSRKARDQVLRSVWVVETDSRKYIFNAISGIIIEEQKSEAGGLDELE